MARDVAVELQRQGHEVSVLASRSNYAGSARETPGADGFFNVKQVREMRGGRLMGWTSFWLQALPPLASRRWDRCVILTDPPFLPFAAWLTCAFRKKQQRLYWWTMDIYPEALVAAAMVRETSLIYRCLRWLNELGLSQMNGVIALGQRQLQRLQTYRRWNRAAGFVALVTPWDIRPIQRVEAPANRVLNRLAGHGKKVALYSGNLGEGHPFVPFVEAAHWFQNQGRTDWLFVFVVRGAGRSELEALGGNLPNMRILDYLPESETPDLLWSATVHLVSMKPGWEGVIVPSKFYGTLQTCAPVLFLGPLDADTATEIHAKERGISLPPTATGEDVVQALDKLTEPVWIIEPQMDVNAPRYVAEFIAR